MSAARRLWQAVRCRAIRLSQTRHTFRGKLVLVQLVVVIIPITILVLTTSYWSRRIIADKFSGSMEQSVHQTAANIDLILNDVRNSSNNILTNQRLINLIEKSYVYDPTEIENLLRSFYAASDYIEGLSVFRSDYAFSVGYEHYASINVLAGWINSQDIGQGEINWLVSRQELVKSITGAEQHYFFSLARRLINLETNRVIGNLLIDVDESLLADTCRSLNANTPGLSFICDESGVIISHSNKDWIGQKLPDPVLLNQIVNSPSLQGSLSYDAAGVTTANDLLLPGSIVYYSTCQVTGWRLISVIPTAYLFREINYVVTLITLASLILLAGATVVILISSRRLTQPISNLMDGMRQIETGNLEITVANASQDEIGRLTQAFNSMVQDIKRLLARIVQEEQQKQQVELEAMRAQINPHFLYNTLNSIKWMAKIQGADNVGQAITALTKLLRVSINLTKDMISLQEEIEYVRNYVFIMKMRFNDQVEIDYAIPDECASLRVQKLILQPIVENSLVHAVKDNDHLVIRITAQVAADKLIIAVADNGQGMAEDQVNTLLIPQSVSKMSSVGIANVHNRIQMHHGPGYGLAIASQLDQGTRVTVTLPVIQP